MKVKTEFVKHEHICSAVEGFLKALSVLPDDVCVFDVSQNKNGYLVSYTDQKED